MNLNCISHQESTRGHDVAEESAKSKAANEVIKSLTAQEELNQPTDDLLPITLLLSGNLLQTWVYGVEGSSKNYQILGCSLSPEQSKEVDGLLNIPGKIHSAASDYQKWLTEISQVHLDVPTSGDPWSRLRITDEAAGFMSPAKKRDSGVKTAVASPVSTLVACWSPQAMSAPPLKTKRSAPEIACSAV